MLTRKAAQRHRRGQGRTTRSGSPQKAQRSSSRRRSALLVASSPAQPASPSTYGREVLTCCLVPRRPRRRQALSGTRPSDCGRRADRGRTALWEASARGHAAVCAALLDAGASPDAEDWSGSSPLVVAARRGRTRAVAAFVRAATRLPPAGGRITQGSRRRRPAVITGGSAADPHGFEGWLVELLCDALRPRGRGRALRRDGAS